jgi:hypothetical protein
MRYRTEIIWPPFKGKAYKVIDSTTGVGVGLYRTAEGARRKARAMNVAAATSIVHPAEGAARVEYAPVEQLAIAPDASIVAEPVTAPEPRHETVRLFEPAPNQMPGQLAF